MTLSDLSIRRPVFAWMLMFGLIVFGAVCFNRMGISQMPDVDLPIVSLTARYPGAAPEVMETDVIDPIEDAVMSIEGVRTVRSEALNGVANIIIEFHIDRNIDLALQDVQGKLAQAQDQLPQDMEPVVIFKANPDDFPIMWLAVTNPTMERHELMTFVRDQVRDRLTTVPGVGSLWTPGYLEPNMRIWVDPEKLVAFGLTMTDVIDTVESEHSEPPAGRVDHKDKEYNIRTMGEATTPERFANLLINNRGSQPNYVPIPLSKVARVEQGTEDVFQFARSDKKPAVGLGVVKQRGANAVEVARGVRDRIKEIRGTLPEGTTIKAAFDSSEFVEESIDELVLTLVLAAALTSLVCWLFLGSWTSTLNVLLAIPTSVIGSFIILYFAGFTLNLFTLLGLSLAIGIVVDDAIIVLENIIRHREHGRSRMEAAIIGARQITFAAMASTISIVAIFLPIAFMQGIIGKFLYQFGVTMSAAVLLSLLEAITLTPMRASQFVEASRRRTRIGHAIEAFLERMRAGYIKSLSFSLRHRWTVLSTAFVFFAISFALAGRINKEFQPPQDQGHVIIRLTTPVGSSLDLTSERLKVIENFLSSRPSVESFFAAVGGFTGGETNSAIIFIAMKSKGERGLEPELGHAPSQQELMAVLRDNLPKALPDSQVVVQDPSTQGFSGSEGFPVEFAVSGPDWQKLADHTEAIMAEMRNSGLTTDVHSDYQGGAPEIQVLPNRQKASASGVSIEAIGRTVNAALAGEAVGRYPTEGHRYDIRVKAEEDEKHPVEIIKSLFVRNNRGETLPLASLVEIRERPAAASISRKDRQRAITIMANVAPGKSQQAALDSVQEIAKRILPAGYNVALSGSAEEFRESFQGLIFAIVLGLFVSYMVLGSQFNSFIDPITVFMAMPFSFSGAFLALLIGGQSLNISSMIGLVLLLGIVKKNSILLVDYTNQQRDIARAPVKEALMRACPTRLRPILMTSLATMAGALPAAVSLGPGAESRRPMAIAVLGGVLVSTALTLYVVPCVYSLLARFDRRSKEARPLPTSPEASQILEPHRQDDLAPQRQ